MVYLDAFEHICDPLEQQRAMQIITDLMAKRPILELEKLHFKQSYRAEIDALNAHREFMQTVISLMLEKERKTNKELREYLRFTYKIANEFIG